MGTGFCVYRYSNTPNQHFAIEEENGKVYLKGEQSQLYIEVFGEGDLRLAERANATAFSIKKTNKAVPQNVVDSVRNTLVFATYGPGDASIGDLDGDGEWEVVLKWDPSNTKDSSHGGQSGRVLVPVRVIAEAFGMIVDWNGEERVVTIKRGKAREDFVNVFALGDEQGVTKMLDYFFDKSVGIIKVNSIDEIINKAEDGDYAVILSDADTAELESMGVTVINAKGIDIKASDNYEKFKAAEKIAELMCYLPDCTSRKENGYVQTASFSGEKAFDVSIWGEVPYYRVTIEGNATVGINGENYLTWEMDDKVVIYLEGSAKELPVNSQGNARVTVEPCNEMEKTEFKAPDDMNKVREVAGVVRYENETKVTLFNSTDEIKKVKIGNSIVNVMPKCADYCVGCR